MSKNGVELWKIRGRGCVERRQEKEGDGMSLPAFGFAPPNRGSSFNPTFVVGGMWSFSAVAHDIVCHKGKESHINMSASSSSLSS